jgi:kynurenine 3-monooxygenase
MARRKITISGAGLVGSLLSVLLGQRGYEVTIYERRPDTRSNTEDSGRSINLALSSRGIHALKMAGLMDDVKKLLIPMRGRMLHFQDGTQEFSPYGQRPHEVIYSVSRRDLNELMVTAAVKAKPVNVVFEHQLESVDFQSSQLTMLDLKTNTMVEQDFDLLIGADGAGSRVRRALIEKTNGQSDSQFLDHDYKELEIPAGDSGSWQIEKEALHVWPRGGYMLIALPNQDGSFTVTLFMPKTGENSFESLQNEADVTKFFNEHFADAVKLIPDLATDYANNAQGRLGTLRCSPWFVDDQCLIMGDASHAIVPFHGQGMNSGFEDCSELIRLLDLHDENWETVIKEFDRIRKPNAEAIADMALENYVTMRSSVSDPKFQLKKEIGFKLEKRFPDRFVPRYSMVMFHLLPYASAFERGKVQQAILDELVQGVDDINDVDFELAKSLVEERLAVVQLD